MSLRYYAAEIRETVSGGEQIKIIGSGHDHDQAIRHHTIELEANSPLVSPGWRRTVLLDLGSVDLDAGQMDRILLTDPVLRAIYELGRQHEHSAAHARADAEAGNPA